MKNLVLPPPPLKEIKSVKVKEYFTEINYLRGLSIFFIVWCHCVGMIRTVGGADWSSTWWILDNVRATVVDGSSSLFVFISGFLFYHIFYKRGFEYRPFLKGKLLKVFLPWLLITTVFAAYRLSRGQGSFFDSNFVYYGCYYYWSFWYVPFIMVTFLCSCFYIKFIEADTKSQILVLVVSTAFSMCLGRHNGNAFLSALFWNAFYLFGIFVGVNYYKMKSWDIGTKQCVFAATVLALAALASSGDWHYIKDWGTYHLKLNERIEWMVLGKMLLCVSLVGIFYYFKDHGWRWLRWTLNLLAKYSFSIFFLHQFALLWLERHPHRAFFAQLNFYGLHTVAFIAGIVMCVLCIAVAAPVKKLTGKYSRMVIGA